MNPLARLGASLFVSVVLSWPVFLACVNGTTDLESAVLRWSLAFIGAKVVFAVIGRMLDAYRPEPDDPGAPGADPGDADSSATDGAEELRRSDDGQLASP